MSILQSKYPILAAPMNQVSDINLAIAVSRAGAYPSLSLFNYGIKKDHYDLDRLDNDLNFFEQETGSKHILISMGANELIYNTRLLEILVEREMLDIELLENVNDQTIPDIQEIRKKLKSKNFRLFFKEIAPRMIMEVDALILKGPEGAGRSLKNGLSLMQLFLKMKKSFPSLPMIPSGGIGTAEDVQTYLKLGADSISIGTLFAAAIESPISYETKLKMISSTFQDVEKFENVNQNALIFKRIENDDVNNTKSLKLGISDPGAGGHVFVGKSIDNIDQIRSAKDIVDDLVRELDGN